MQKSGDKPNWPGVRTNKKKNTEKVYVILFGNSVYCTLIIVPQFFVSGLLGLPSPLPFRTHNFFVLKAGWAKPDPFPLAF